MPTVRERTNLLNTLMGTIVLLINVTKYRQVFNRKMLLYVLNSNRLPETITFCYQIDDDDFV